MSSLLDGKSGQSYNISGNNEMDNTTIVKRFLDIMEKSEDLIEYVKVLFFMVDMELD